MVAESLEALRLAPEDAAAAALAVEYGRTVDRAAAIAAQADKTLRAAQAAGDEALVEQVAALRSKVAAQAAVSDLGPKMLAALDALGGTPKARAAKGAPAPAAGSRLAALRGDPA
jgi:hypothetical protein